MQAGRRHSGPQGFDPETLDALLNSPDAQALGGLSLVLRWNGREQYRAGVRGFEPERSGPIASGTKWLIAALCLRACMSHPNRLRLDTTPAELLSGWGAGDLRMGNITLRQLLSHTSGLPGVHDCVGAKGLSLRETAIIIGSLPLGANPGESFYYGECGFSVAGAMVEAATGLDIHLALEQCVTAPLGMRQTSLGPAGDSPPSNPHLGGGAFSSAVDYALLLQALHASWDTDAGGGRRFLSHELVLEMFTDQTAGLPLPFSYTPYTLLGPERARRRYGLGCWREEVAANGRLCVAGSQGRSGFSPWIDLVRGIQGVLYAESDFISVTPVYEALRDACGLQQAPT